MNTSKQITLRKGERLPLFQPGGSGPQIFSAEDMNVYVRAINALMNPKIIRGPSDDIILSDQNVIYQIGPDPQVQAGGSTPAPTGYTGPLDSAVYVPAAGGHGEYIAGVHGSRIFTFDATTGLPTGTQADYFASWDNPPKFGNATVAYDTANDLIWAACVNGWFDWKYNSPNYMEKTLNTLNPTTLAVVDSADLDDYGAGPGQFGSQGFHRLMYNPTTGWMNAVVAQNSSSASISMGTGGALVIDPGYVPGSLASYFDVDGVDGWTDTAVGYQIGGTRDDVWFLAPGTSKIHCYDSIANSLRLTITLGFSLIPFCIEYCPYNDSVYIGNGGNYDIYSSAGVKGTSGPVIGDFYNAIRVKWNPFDSKLYFAIPGNGKVAVVDPASSNSVVKKTGFDLPVDFVFTGSKNWCVQQGNVGLKEIV